MFEQVFIHQQEYRLSYRIYPGGGRYMILFHGFGQSADSFDALSMQLAKQYTVIAIDLFFHGESLYAPVDSKPISPEDWSRLFEQVLLRHHIQRFSILGFSMGARFVTASLQAFGVYIDSVILIAPDGMVVNPWYTLATSTFPARWLFRYIVYHPAVFLKLCAFLTQLNSIDDRIAKFASSQMTNEEQRVRVYHSWMYFRKLRISEKTFVAVVKKYRMDVKMIFGGKDRIVKKSFFARWIKHSQARVCVLDDTSHSRIISRLTEAKVLQFLISDRK